MGLLDFANTDEGMQGLGLLGAAAPSMAPMNLAGRIAMAVQGYQGLRKDALQNKLLTLQEMRAQQQFEMQKDAYYGDPASMNVAPQAASGGMASQAPQMPTMSFGAAPRDMLSGDPVQRSQPMPDAPSAPAMPAAAPQSNLAGQLDRLRRMAIAQVPGSKEGFELLKYGNEMQTLAPGILRNPVTGQITTLPTTAANGTSSMPVFNQATGEWSITAPKGAVDTARTYADALKDNDIVKVPNGSGGTKDMLMKDYRAMLGGGQAAPLTASVPPSQGGESSGGFQLVVDGKQTDPQEMMRRIAQIKDPKQRAASTQIMQQIIADHSQPAMSATTQASQGGSLNGILGFTPSSADMAADQARKLAEISQGTKPQLDYSTNAAQGLQKMGEMINGRLSESQALLQRISESRDALSRFKAGGGNEARLGMAQSAQALGLPTTIVDRIAGGDLSAVQEFQKFAAQEALQTMQQSLSTDSGPAAKGNRLSMDLFIKNNPNITTDPRAIEKIFNFQTKLHDDALAQSNAFSAYVKDPSKVKDPAIFGNEWANANLESGRVKAVMQSGQALGTSAAKLSNTPMKGQVVSGFKFKGGNPADKNNWEQQ